MKLIVKNLFLSVLCGLLVCTVSACAPKKDKQADSYVSEGESSAAQDSTEKADDTEESFEDRSESSEGSEESTAEESEDIMTDGDFGYILAEGVAQLCAYYGDDTVLDIPEELGGNSVTAITAGAFANNTSLLQINVGNSVVNVAEGAFSGCTALEKVSLGNGVAVVYASSFDACPALEEIEVSVANGSYSTVEGVLYTKDKSELVRCPQGLSAEEFVVPEGTSLVGNGAFRKCSGINAVVLPEGCELSSNAFFHCDNLRTFSFEGAVSTVPDYCFFGCVLLEEIALPEGVECLGEYAFFGCVGLRKLSLPATVTAISDTAFECCTGIEEAEVEGDCATEWYSNYQK
ncbi:MAG: hypothetical protein E7597_00770 [Ruminococcaceae bacterium]|nr:hypothetical protein [Oscillospiraceae bacterium]